MHRKLDHLPRPRLNSIRMTPIDYLTQRWRIMTLGGRKLDNTAIAPRGGPRPPLFGVVSACGLALAAALLAITAIHGLDRGASAPALTTRLASAEPAVETADAAETSSAPPAAALASLRAAMTDASPGVPQPVGEPERRSEADVQTPKPDPEAVQDPIATAPVQDVNPEATLSRIEPDSTVPPPQPVAAAVMRRAVDRSKRAAERHKPLVRPNPAVAHTSHRGDVGRSRDVMATASIRTSYSAETIRNRSKPVPDRNSSETPAWRIPAALAPSR